MLTDDEEEALVREVAAGPIDVVGYSTSSRTRARIERQMFERLRRHLVEDQEAFHQKYVFRSAYDEDAQQLFPALLDGYGRLTRRAVLGSFGGEYLIDDLPDALTGLRRSESVVVTLLSPSRIPWRRPNAIGRVSFDAARIEKLMGTVTSFVLICTRFTIRFGDDFVRISIV